MDVALGIDLGQSSVKITALSTADDLSDFSAQAAYSTSSPRPGWLEQDPADWRAAVARASRELLAELGPDCHVLGVCLTGATHHAVLLDAEGSVLRPVITMRDLRSTAQAQALAASHGDLVLDRTRNSPDAAWSLPHLMWIRENEPLIWAEVRHLLFGKDFLVRELTGTLVTDTIEAEGSLLWNVAAADWDAELLQLAALHRAQLPDAVPTGQRLGVITSAGSRWSGLPAGIPVFAGSSDTAAEAFASGANRAGATVIKLATSGNVNVVTDQPRPGPGWITYSHVEPGLAYHAMAVSSAAGAFDWLRRAVDPSGGLSFGELDAAAADVRAGADGVVFLPYLGGMRAPEWDPSRRAAFVGLDAGHGRGHLVRALYEGVAFSVRDCAEVLVARGFSFADNRIIGGGARSALWRQLIADMLDVALTVPRFSEASAGAALIARRSLTGNSPTDLPGNPLVVTPGPDRAALAAGYRSFNELSLLLRDFDRRRYP